MILERGKECLVFPVHSEKGTPPQVMLGLAPSGGRFG